LCFTKAGFGGIFNGLGLLPQLGKSCLLLRFKSVTMMNYWVVSIHRETNILIGDDLNPDSSVCVREMKNNEISIRL
jgi:hypothetical protein